MSCFNLRELPSSQPKIPWVWLNRTQALNSFNEFQWIHSCISRFPILGVFSISLNINYCCTFVRMFLSTLSPIFNITFFRHKMAYHYTLYIYYSNLNLLKTFKTSVNCCKLPYYMEAVSPFMMPSFYYIYVIKYLFYLHVKNSNLTLELS